MSMFGLSGLGGTLGNVFGQPGNTTTALTNTYTYPIGNAAGQQQYIGQYQYPATQPVPAQQQWYTIPQPNINVTDLSKLYELAEIERRIDKKIAELRALDREGLLNEMLVLTGTQLEALRSAPKYEAPKEVIPDRRQMELPLELVEELAF